MKKIHLMRLAAATALTAARRATNGRRRRECREPNADAWLLVRVRIAGSRTNGRQDPLGAVRHAERKLEIQLGARRRPATDGLFPRRLQRQRLERHARAGTLGAERIRRSGLPQRRLRLAGLVQKRSAARSRRPEPRGFLPPYGRHPRRHGPAGRSSRISAR